MLLSQHGWLIITQLIQVSYFTSQSKLKEALVLLQNQMQTHQYNGVLTIINALLANKQLSENVVKFLAQQLATILNSKPTDPHSKYFMLYAFCQINPKHYSSSINSLIQLSVDEALISTYSWENITLQDLQQQNDQHFHTFGLVKNPLLLILQIMKFLNHIMKSQSFTTKNKINFAKYLQTNL